MSPARKRGILIGAALAVVAIVVAAVVLLVKEDPAPAATGGPGEPASGAQESPAQVATRFLRQFDTGDLSTAPVDDPAAASAALSGARGALKPAAVKTTLGEVPTTPGNATTTSATFHASWTFVGNSVWTYEGKLELVRNAGKWVVHWAPSVIHPKLEAGQQLSAVPVTAKPIVADRDGKALVGGDTGGVAPILQGALSKVASEQGGGGTAASVAISRVDASGKPVEALFGQPKETGKPLVSTLSVASQNAAQKAVDGYQGSAIIVAMKTGGDILAVAQNAAAGNQPKALSGLYAPGSAFKIATAAAALQQGGVSADTQVACPGSEQIGTRTLKNDNGFDLGTVSLKTAFAASCNTTFGRLAGGLPADGLAKAATQFGLNADFEIPGLSTETGKVEASSSGDEQVEAGIGQGRVQVSPLGAALMAATVAAGKPVVPKLWKGLETTVNTGYQAPSAGVLNQVRAMMREVCTTGTAKALKSSGAVFGKTGTAQFGSGADANGWFVGYRGDVAFAVMLEGSNDSKPAVQLAAKFLAG